MELEVARWQAAWSSQWADLPPVPFRLRLHRPRNWVRFHALPQSQRYPETAAQYATVWQRHRRLLTELCAHGGDSPQDLVVVAQGGFAFGPSRQGELGDLLYEQIADRWRQWFAQARFWREHVEMDGAEAVTWQFVLAPCPLGAARSAALLRAVADEEMYSLFLAPPDARWLYHPYAGGADVIAAPEVIAQLRAAHPDWLPTNATGL
ncbi:DUF3885 domain-containing protein [Buchananella hordeovulneris]|uniref:DUF3885 domain-containing protein n=1 Tax=Buchananella hordeovulneris TaxID=52770 RepID=UPI000F5F4268|nr:hypothetical protein [Buchananella hordeovulneris]RRD45363.1 hypothetical protein EII13_00345 [Buchananella hordeovulneris]